MEEWTLTKEGSVWALRRGVERVWMRQRRATLCRRNVMVLGRNLRGRIWTEVDLTPRFEFWECGETVTRMRIQWGQ
eukprot:2653524-Rhodomonas_salina.1